MAIRWATVGRSLALVGLLVTACANPGPGSSGDPAAMRVRVVEDFKLGEPGDAWAFRTPGLWKVTPEGERQILRLTTLPSGPVLPGVPRPREYAVYTRYRFGSFSLSCRVRNDTDPALAGRDACLVFGRQDATHFYYVHLSNADGECTNTVVRVDGDSRTDLLPPGKRPTPAITDRQWHKVDVLRDLKTGAITVYVDAYEAGAQPWAQLRDGTYPWGHIALGSFDAQASFAHLLIEGEAKP